MKGEINMCGFVGFTNIISDNESILDKMMNRIIHRGPDSSGKFLNKDIALDFEDLALLIFPKAINRCLMKITLWF